MVFTALPYLMSFLRFVCIRHNAYKLGISLRLSSKVAWNCASAVCYVSVWFNWIISIIFIEEVTSKREYVKRFSSIFMWQILAYFFSKKSTKMKFSTRYITIFFRRMQRLPIFKIPIDVNVRINSISKSF